MENESTLNVNLDLDDFTKSISQMDSVIGNLIARYNKIKFETKDWEESSTMLSTSVTTLTNVVEVQKLKIEQLKKKQESLNNVFDQGSQASIDLQTELINQKSFLSSLEKQLNKLKEANDKSSDSSKVFKDELKSSDKILKKFNESLQTNEVAAKNAEKQNKSFSDFMDGVVSNAIDSASGTLSDFTSELMNLGDSTKDYRTTMAEVAVSANNAGVAQTKAQKYFENFYKYLGSESDSASAVKKLVEMNDSCEDLNETANAAISVWTAYGDSMSVDQLLETINTTAQGKEITEEFSEVLKNAGVSEEEFKKQLEKTGSTSEAVSLINKTLLESYGKSKNTYDHAASSVLSANEAELKLLDTESKLAEEMSPVNDKMMELKNTMYGAVVPAVSSVVDTFGPLPTLLGTTLLQSGGLSSGLSLLTSLFSNNTKTLEMNKDGLLGVKDESNLLVDVLGKVFGAHNLAWGGVAVAGIAALTAGLIAYNENIQQTIKDNNENWNETQQLKDQYAGLNEELEKNIGYRDEEKTSLETQVATAEVLEDKISALADKENKSNLEKQKMKEYVQELNAIYPDLNASYDEENDKLNMTVDTLRNKIQVEKEAILAAAAQEQLVDIAKDMVQAEIELQQVEEQHSKNKQALDAIDAQLDEAYAKRKEDLTIQERNQLEEKIGALLRERQVEHEAYSESESLLQGAKEAYQALNEEYAATETYAQNVINATSDVNEAFASLNETCKEAGVSIPESVETGIKEGTYKIPESVEEMKALINYDDMITSAQEAGTAIPQAIQDQVTAGQAKPAEAMQLMQEMMGFEQLASAAGESGSSIIDGIVQGISDGELSVSEATSLLKQKINDGVTLTSSDYYSLGNEVASGIALGLDENSYKVNEAMRNMAQGSINIYRAINQIASPSKLYKKLSSHIPEGIAEGIKSSQGKAKDTIGSMANSLYTEAQSSMSMQSLLRNADYSLLTVGGQNVNRTSNSFTSNTDNQKTIVFNQYNNSPKALSRKDIYRQTQTMLNIANRSKVG